MRQDHCSKRLLGFLLLLILLLPGCSIPKPSSYPPANPLVFVYQHNIDLTSLKDEIEEDSLMTLDLFDDGIKLYTNSLYGGGYEMEVWLNDSLILVNVKAFLCDHWENIHTTSGKIRFESRLRKQRSNLGSEIFKNLNSGNLRFYNKSSFTDAHGYQVVHHRDVSLEIPIDHLTVEDQLSWQGSVFDQPMELSFKQGILNGDVVIRDTNNQTIIKGFYNNGFEESDWKVYDMQNQLQWTERYSAGELQKVIYEKEATIQRPAPLPTFRKTIILHRVVFYVLLMITLSLLFIYFKALLKTKHPYKGETALMIFGKVLAGPFLAAVVIFICYFLSMILAGLFQSQSVWDLPLDFFLLLSFGLFYFLIGTVFFVATFRYLDVFWHGGLLMLIYILTEEYLYLHSLEAGLF